MKQDDLNQYIARYTDRYLLNTKAIVKNFDKCKVTYAIFLRSKAIYACNFAIIWLQKVAKQRNISIDIIENFHQGDIVEPWQVLYYVTGDMDQLADLETIMLQKTGSPCISAYNAYLMCSYLPTVSFLAFDARHCTNYTMSRLMSYGAYVGSEQAKKQNKACGFIGSSTKDASEIFNTNSIGTMPHSLIGYAGSTLKAAQLFKQHLPNERFVVLVDYFGTEVDDTLELCNHFKTLAHNGELSIRIDIHGQRFCQYLDQQKSLELSKKYFPNIDINELLPPEQKYLIGKGVSAVAIFYIRQCLDSAGFNKVKIVASSGFNVDKCKAMALVKAPINVIGTGSYIPNFWHDSHATADIIAYNDKISIKTGREHLIKDLPKFITKTHSKK